MKKGIHPEYNELTVVLSDGTEIKTRSTLNPEGGVYRSEVDSRNHPFYTNKQQFSQKAGRIDRFYRKYGNKAENSESETKEEENTDKEE